MMAKLLSKHYPLVYFDNSLNNESITKIGDQLYLGNLQGHGLARHGLRIDPKEIANSLSNIMNMLNIDEPIFLFDYPYWQPILEHIKPYKVLYNCMDDYTEFSDLNVVKDIIDEQEVKLFKSSDLVYCTSKGLYEKAKRYTDKVIIIPNACEWDKFSTNFSRPTDLPYGKIAGFIGCIAEWFDQEAVSYMASQLPQWNFILIGNSSVDISVLNRRENIFLFGEQEHSKIFPYLKYFDVAIIPFDAQLPIMQNCNPVKYFEYSAAGKPIVSCPLPDLLELKEQGREILFANYVEAWPNKILEAYEQSKIKGFAEKQSNDVKDDTWENRVVQLLKKMKEIGC